MLTDIAVILFIVLVFPYVYPNAQAQTATTLTPADKFNIPAYNGTISFAVNGSYTKATLENNFWTFYGLKLGGSTPFGNLKISTENSNVTVRTYSSFNNTASTTRIGYLRYNVQGKGKQTINLGLNLTQSSEPFQWSVVTGNNVYLGEGEGWSLLPNDTLVIRDADYNVSISRYGFSIDRSQPFIMQHSVAIATGILVACTVAARTAISVNQRRRRK